MSEMLGNHYFLSRDFALAIDAFSKTFRSTYPNNILKKLIICHITQGNVSIAKEYFLNILNEDPYIIIDTDIVDEDCPCPDLINQIESKFYPASNLDDLISLGILWLYCNVEKSLEYFKKAIAEEPGSSFIQNSIKIINRINSKKKASS